MLDLKMMVLSIEQTSGSNGYERLSVNNECSLMIMTIPSFVVPSCLPNKQTFKKDIK